MYLSIFADEVDVDVKIEADELPNNSSSDDDMDDSIAQTDDIDNDEANSDTFKNEANSDVGKSQANSDTEEDEEDFINIQTKPKKKKPPKKPAAKKDKKLYECTICQKQFKICAALHNHLYKFHIDEFDCIPCDITFKSYLELQAHIVTHRKEIILEQAKEPIVESKEAPDEPAVEHVEAADASQTNAVIGTMECDDETDKCQYCGIEMDSHRPIDSGNNEEGAKVQYECCQCKIYLFPRLTKLRVHMRCHQKNVLCTLCGATFDTKYKLTKHTRIHTGEKSRQLIYKCEQCEKTFLYKMGLTRHMAEHTGNRPFNCDECHRSFAVKFDLKKHKLEKHGRAWQLSCR